MLRLVDLLAGLSRLADLGYSLPAGNSLRSAALAVTLGRSLDLSDEDLRGSLYTALLLHVGCTGYAHETARATGDEMAWNAAVERADLTRLADIVASFLPALIQGRPRVEQARLAALTVARGRRLGAEYALASCEVGRDAARRLHLPDAVQQAIYRGHEWWNGRGEPDGLRGDEVPLPARVAHVTATAALFDTIGGVDAVVEVLRQRSGSMMDPAVAHHLADRAASLIGEVNAADPRDLVLEGEPRPLATVAPPRLVDVARVFGEIADLKSPYLHGHSSGVAALARDAGRQLGLEPGQNAELEVAGFLHDVGRVAISTSVWEKPGELSAHEWEQVRMHTYHSERILAGSERLSAVAELVGGHHERCDGSGYHRGCDRRDLTVAARVLATADAYQAMTQRRPHRPARPRDQAAQLLGEAARAGHLDADAVAAVLAAAGHETVVQREPPAGLTPREVEVLGLVARGCSNPDIASQLVISRRTAEQHVQNVYRKIGVASRAAAALFAMEHDLLPREERAEDP